MRVRAVDTTRGIAIVLMALDHVRDFLTSFPYDPLDIEHTTPIYFATRWITHLCAPLFIFLAGASAFLRMHAGATKHELAKYLASRGAFLVLLEITVIGFAWWFRIGIDHPGLTLQVIWVIGASLMVLSVVIFFPRWLTTTVATVLIAGHNLVPHESQATLWQHLLHDPGITAIGPLRAYVAYPLIPWVAMMMLGFACGPVFAKPSRERRTTLITAVILSGCAFVLLRWIGIYGDPRPFDANSPVPWMSFLHVAKYPPSLHFSLVMACVGATCLLIADHLPVRLSDPLVVFGRAPLFFYVSHLYLGHAAAVLIGALQGYPPEAFFNFFTRFPDGYGLSLPAVYAAWAGLVVMLYWPSVRYAQLRRRFPRLMSYL